MTAVAFRQVSLTLGASTILTGVDFTIRPGEFIDLLGPNGAGKTTLLRAVLGLLEPSAGAIQVLGQPATRGNRAVGYMPQNRSSRRASPCQDGISWPAPWGWRWGLPMLSAAERAEVAWPLRLHAP